MQRGTFAKLVDAGLSEARADGRRVVILYSLGPNRSRDSNRSELLGYDIGLFMMDEPNR